MGELFRLVSNGGAGSGMRTITVKEALGIGAVAMDGAFQPAQLARPYIARLSIFSRLICPSV